MYRYKHIQLRKHLFIDVFYDSWRRKHHLFRRTILRIALHFRFKNQILCDLHFADVALMECSDFMQQLRSFKPQSLGCAVARRKSSTTLIFPLPPQACSGKYSSSSRSLINFSSFSHRRVMFSRMRPMQRTPSTFAGVHMHETELQVVSPALDYARLYLQKVIPVTSVSHSGCKSNERDYIRDKKRVTKRRKYDNCRVKSSSARRGGSSRERQIIFV